MDTNQVLDRDKKIRMYPSGRLVNPSKLTPDDIDIEDIAHHLSRISMWYGGTPGFYSVAEHSIKVAASMPKEFCKWGLLHNVPSIFISDIPHKVKSLVFINDFYGSIPNYESVVIMALQGFILKVIAEKFNLPYPVPDEVKKAHEIQLAEEEKMILDHKLHGNLPNMAQTRYLHAWKAAQRW